MSAKSPKNTTVKTAIASPKSAKAAPAAASPVKRVASETTDVKPKKAMCAYFIWLNEVGRKEIIAKKFNGSGSNVAAIVKAAGEVWRAMSDADKKKWNEKAVKDKARHAKEMESYVPSETSGPAKKKHKETAEKDPNKPKKALSGYFFFMQENRNDIIAVDLKGDKSKVAEVAKIAGAKWKAMDEKAREKYQRMAVQDKERYDKEMAEYKKSPPAGDGDDDEEDEEDEE